MAPQLLRHTKTIDINLIINKVPYAASGYFKEGVLLEVNLMGPNF
jgi:hypothetical protein